MIGGKTNSYLNNRRVLLAALDELIIRQPGVLVPVHILEDLVYALNEQMRTFRTYGGRLTEYKGRRYDFCDLGWMRAFSGVSSSAGSLTI